MTTVDYIAVGRLKIHPLLHQLVAEEITSEDAIQPDQVWSVLDEAMQQLAEKNQKLLAKRDELQAQIDAWLKVRAGQMPGAEETKKFLLDIGYLVLEGDDFTITTTNVDEEIALLAGPQLVVPADNARYVLNAANARWGSLYDAFYGTDLIEESEGREKGSRYNAERGELVIDKANQFLNETLPLTDGNWQDARRLYVENGHFTCELASGSSCRLENPDQFAGYVHKSDGYSNLLFRHHKLYIDVLVDRADGIGKQSPAGIKDILLESAISTIVDFEDSVATVDAEDKAKVYRHWAAIMKGTLSTVFKKEGSAVSRSLNPDRIYTDTKGKPLALHGRSLLLVRHVGSHVYTEAVVTDKQEAIPEAFLDAIITVAFSLHDLQAKGSLRNSRKKSLYIVKPKHHGPEEVALSVALFELIEKGFGLPTNTLKIGIMDEERRTTLNLKECIRVASERVIFINTGFLDRTADEIHTCMESGPVMPKLDIKTAPWMLAYEEQNVAIGLSCGFQGRAQIGKGMWPEPDAMAAMLDKKIAHPKTGANCAWVPSPTAATLHALHYHQVDVGKRQSEIISKGRTNNMESLLTLPLLQGAKPTADAIQQELDNNIQGILGYVVRWVEQGIGCSKVPDIHNVGLMEDRATLRISSQHIVNWLHHNLVDKQQVVATLQRMAKIVDEQNAGDNQYQPMAPNFESSLAFQAAADLIFEGLTQPNGYTEHLLIRYRQQFKAQYST